MRKRITKRAVETLEADGRAAFLWDTEVTGFGCKATPKGVKVYIFQYRPHPGGRKVPLKRITLGKHGQLTADQARGLAAKLLLEVKAGGDPARVRETGDAPTMADLAERFLTEYLPGKKRPPRKSTVGFYEALFRCHILPKLGAKQVAKVTTQDVERLHTAMRSKPYVANRTLSLLRNAFDVTERWGWRPQNSNPAIHVDRYPEERRGSKKEVMLTSAQMAKLFEVIKEEEAAGMNPISCAAIRVTFWTGWRINEVLKLRWSDVDLEGGVAKLYTTKTADEEYRQLPDEAITVLRELPQVKGCPYVFPGNDLRRHLTTVRRPWAKIRKRAGLADLPGLGAFRIHDLRHNVVSWDVSRGVPLEIAGKNVGHSSRRSTEVYAHFAPDALKRAADERARAMRDALEGVGV